MNRYVDEIRKGLSEKTIDTSNAFLHPEEYGNSKINNALENGFKYIEEIYNTTTELADKVDTLLNRSIERLETVSDIITSEKERLQDISMLCNAKTDYDNAIPLTDYYFTGNFEYQDGVFSSKTTQSTSTVATVIDVTGNGYEGNKYVLQDKSYLEDILSTSNRNAIVDNNISTYWEYSRITASNTEEDLLTDFNTDSSEAKCTITLKFDQISNELAIKSSIEGLKVVAIRYSNDNLTYKDLNIMPFSLNNKEDSYKNQDYIYGSNIIAFPDSLYVKITFESKGYLNDTIAFDKVIAENDKTSTLTTIVSTAKRHVIRINDIESKRKQYIKESAFKTNELITNKKDIYAISVFANIYLPNNISEDNVSFILTVNGIDYNIKPVNSYSDGIKIIRFSQGKMPVEYTKYIGEKITSAYLTVVIKSKNKLTPYVNNIKVLLGGEI